MTQEELKILEMEAPEKIYFSSTENGTHYYTEGIPFEREFIEYTRIDAFIEKGVNFLEMLGHGFTITDNITHTNYDKDQLVEDFKNYMKGK